MTKGSFLDLRNKSPGLVMILVGVVRLWFSPTVPLIEVLHFSGASIESTLLVSSDVSLFLFPVTHVFHLFCLLSAQIRSVRTTSAAVPQLGTLTAGGMGVGGHLVFL